MVDSAGRKVEVPDRIEKVFAAGPPASILLYMLAPEKMTGWPDPPRLKLDVSYRFGGSSLYASGFACVALGNARGMLDEFIELSKRKVPRWGKNPLADNMIVQVAVSECDTKLESARVYLVQNLRDIESEAARRHDGPTMDERMRSAWLMMASRSALSSCTRLRTRNSLSA